MTTELFIAGVPTPKGSMRAISVQGRARLAPGGTNDQRRRLNEWCKAVTEGARAVHEGEPFSGPVAVNLRFVLARPASHPKTRRTWADGHGTGDIDKLERAVLDALTGVTFADDSQVIALSATKDWGWPTGLHIKIEPAPAGAERATAYAGWIAQQQTLINQGATT